MSTHKDQPSGVVIECDTLVGAWYIPHMPESADFLVALYDNQDGTYDVRSRFKYYNSLASFDQKDKRSHIDATTKSMSREQAIEFVRGAIRALEDASRQKGEEFLVVNGDVADMINRITLQPWAHYPTGKGNA